MEQLHDWLAAMLAWVEGFASSPHGVTALFVISFVESSFFPIPPDVLLIALCLGRPEASFWFALVCSVASVAGGMAGYKIGYYGGRPILRRLFSAEKIRAVERLYERYNAWATGIAGLTPLPYKLFTISGGVFAVNFRIFIIASILSRTLRFMAVAGAIYFFGEPMKAFLDRHLGILTVGFVILIVVGYWALTRVARRLVNETVPVASPQPVAVEESVGSDDRD